KRGSVGAVPLSEHELASRVAQALALRMATAQQLSRTDIEGNTPFDLLEQARAVYSQAYFMSGQAQSIQIAVQGLEQIPQYSSQMTSGYYSAVGVGIVSLKEHGYIVTLLFIN
ncbi:MAG TPA: hypothetical protein PLD54_05240, partial [Candidatus Levybacteria bacterium]|nr:hypothetical protein [Candidatus Levybacteria bacterium]